MVSDRLERILVEHVLPPTLTEEGVLSAADEDYERALNWLRGNPDDIVFAYVYDGDTGECDGVTFIAMSDVRDAAKGRPRPNLLTTHNQCVPAPAEPATTIIKKVED